MGQAPMVFRMAFTIRSDTRYLSLLRQWLAALPLLVGREAFPPKALGACTLALIEAVDNAIFHAHRRRASLPIRLAVVVGKGRVVLDVVDCGCGIGRHLRPRPDAPVTHGRGMFLIHRLMSKVESRIRGGRHVLHMVREL